MTQLQLHVYMLNKFHVPHEVSELNILFSIALFSRFLSPLCFPSPPNARIEINGTRLQSDETQLQSDGTRIEKESLGPGGI